MVPPHDPHIVMDFHDNVLLFLDFLPKLGDNCVRNLVFVPELCSSRLFGGLSGKNVSSQSSCELEERDGFASLPHIGITPCPLQRVPNQSRFCHKGFTTCHDFYKSLPRGRVENQAQMWSSV